MNKHLEATILIVVLALVFGSSALFSEFSMQRFLLGGLFGAYVGFAGLPFIDSKKWEPQYLWCGLLGGLAAITVVLHRTEKVEAVAMAGLIGVVTGLLAPFWAKYL